MNNHKKILISLLAVLMLGIGIPSVMAQSNSLQYSHSNGIVTLSTDTLEVRVSGINQVPHFHWWSPINESVDYHMYFLGLFEANDTNTDGTFTRGTDTLVGPRFMLPVIGWEFSGFLNETEGEEVTAVHFNFTTTSEFDPRPGGFMGDFGMFPDLSEFDVTIQIRVHIDMANPSEIKFDVVIEGWNWTYEDSILVMQFTVVESNHGLGLAERNPSGFQRTGTKFNFANGFMQYNETALAAQNSLEVKASYGEGVGLEAGQSVYLAFEYFGNETLVYDPILGVDSDDPGVGSDLVAVLSSPTSLLLIGGILIVVLVAVIIKLKK
ncbi:MAG: hypothetical protein P1Q69_12500 [Candidatus Thorarchaeota archaeon]|nr:hypothetical protein [Candidatus Thorarchaeota archaeon]